MENGKRPTHQLESQTSLDHKNGTWHMAILTNKHPNTCMDKDRPKANIETP